MAGQQCSKVPSVEHTGCEASDADVTRIAQSVQYVHIGRVDKAVGGPCCLAACSAARRSSLSSYCQQGDLVQEF